MTMIDIAIIVLILISIISIIIIGISIIFNWERLTDIGLGALLISASLLLGIITIPCIITT